MTNSLFPFLFRFRQICLSIVFWHPLYAISYCYFAVSPQLLTANDTHCMFGVVMAIRYFYLCICHQLGFYGIVYVFQNANDSMAPQKRDNCILNYDYKVSSLYRFYSVHIAVTIQTRPSRCFVFFLLFIFATVTFSLAVK